MEVSIERGMGGEIMQGLWLGVDPWDNIQCAVNHNGPITGRFLISTMLEPYLIYRLDNPTETQILGGTAHSASEEGECDLWEVILEGKVGKCIEQDTEKVGKV